MGVAPAVSTAPTLLPFLLAAARAADPSCPSPDPTPPPAAAEGQQQSGWRWARAPCDPSRLVLHAPASLDPNPALEALVEDAAAVSRACGVVAVVDAAEPSAVAEHWAAMEAELRPYTKSRQRVREAMLSAGAAHRRSYNGYKDALAKLWAGGGLAEEPALAGGYRLRERSAGRVDLQLGYRRPYNATALTAGAVVTGLVQRLMVRPCPACLLAALPPLCCCRVFLFACSAPIEWPANSYACNPHAAC